MVKLLVVIAVIGILIGRLLPAVQAARSKHSGGVNVSMADGSVRFVSETVDLEIWRATGAARKAARRKAFNVGS